MIVLPRYHLELDCKVPKVPHIFRSVEKMLLLLFLGVIVSFDDTLLLETLYVE